MEPLLQARGLWLPRRPGWALEVPALDVYEGEILALFGPNGAGKSTLLAVLAALLPPRRGEVRFRGRCVDPRHSLDYRRRIAVVLQRPLLFRGTVWENVALGLRFRGLDADTIHQRVHTWLHRLGIGHLAGQSARRLSGGQAQRVALARALALNPDILFLDEPFQALDAPSRMALLAELRTILHQEGRTALYVTHDLNEGLALAHRVAVMVNGRIRQIGPPETLLTRPADADVARLMGMENLLPCRILARDRQLAYVDVHGLTCLALAAGELRAGDPAWLGLRPEALTLWAEEAHVPTSARNRFPVRVLRVWPQGALARVEVEGHAGCRLTALVTALSAREMGLEPGRHLWVAFKASAAWVFPRNPGSAHGETAIP